jgi:AraC family transcriptional regulator of adaptative response / methylphosphotriester-DNA alkyltransferase methyltransferase
MRDGTLERRQAILRDALGAILREHGPGVGIDTVAQNIGTSRRQLQRVFAEMGDGSFRSTLSAVRMARARQLLARTDQPIGEIGATVGYPMPAQFSKTFRHRHGVSPREYRRAAREGAPPPAILSLDEGLPDDRGAGMRLVGAVAGARADR